MRKMRKTRKMRKMRKIRKTQKGGWWGFMEFIRLVFSLFNRETPAPFVFRDEDKDKLKKFNFTDENKDKLEKIVRKTQDNMDIYNPMHLANPETPINPIIDELRELYHSNELDMEETFDCDTDDIIVFKHAELPFLREKDEKLKDAIFFIPTNEKGIINKKLQNKVRLIEDSYPADIETLEKESKFLIISGDNKGKIGTYISRENCDYELGIKIDEYSYDKNFYNIKDLVLFKIIRRYDGGKSKRKRRRNVSQKKVKGFFK